jgi:hypothetical protein
MSFHRHALLLLLTWNTRQVFSVRGSFEASHLSGGAVQQIGSLALSSDPPQQHLPLIRRHEVPILMMQIPDIYLGTV